MRKPSSRSAGAAYLDRGRRLEELRASARRAAAALPAIRRIVLFGSLAHGIPTPRSDADLLIVVDRSEQAEPRNRIPEMLGALRPLPCPVDLIVLTAEEVARHIAEGHPLLREVFAHGLDLL